NRCPAVAPMSVLDESSQERLKLDIKTLKNNDKKLASYPDFYSNLLTALKIMDKQRQTSFVADPQDVDSQLYDGFFGDKDRTAMSVVRAADKDEIASLDMEFEDPRLNALLPLYKARNYPKLLSDSERKEWEAFCKHRLLDGGDKSR